MALSRSKVVDAALTQLQDHGLPSLSMRQVAGALGVQPGALYWHVKSKQDLLALLAERILDAARTCDGDDVRAQVLTLRQALLAVRDGAEVVSFAQALRPGALPALRRLRDILAADLPDQQATWGARTLVHYLLGAVAEEQNHAELARAGIVEPATGGEQAATEAFVFGVDAVLAGLGVTQQ